MAPRYETGNVLLVDLAVDQGLTGKATICWRKRGTH
jgi:hypothetical protein